MTQRKSLLLLIPLVLVIALVATFVNLRGNEQPVAIEPSQVASTPQPSSGLTDTPTQTTQPAQLAITPQSLGQLAPVVIERRPELGEELKPTQSIELVFDRPMNQDSVSQAIQTAAHISGTVSWSDARTLRFTPNTPWMRNSSFDLSLAKGVLANDGTASNDAFQFRFQTAGFLEVGQVIPAPNSNDVAANSAITIIFNRPVVPLVSNIEQSTLPVPLRLEPAVSGSGKWLNTSTYVFTPDAPLPAETSFSARIAASLQDIAGNPLQSEYSWQFRVAAPTVITTIPENHALKVPLNQTLRVEFNQELDPQIANGALRVSSDKGDLPGTLGVFGNTLLFTPTQLMELDERYTAQISAGVGGPSGSSGLAQPYTWSFQSVTAPRIVNTEPKHGAGDFDHTDSVVLTFNNPIDPSSVMSRLSISPAVDATKVYTYYSSYDSSFHINWGLKPSTDYRMRIAAGISDPFGNQIAQDQIVDFRTARINPDALLLMPGSTVTLNSSQPSEVVLRSVNTTQVSFKLYQIDPLELTKHLDWSNPIQANSTLLRSWNEQLSTPLNDYRNTRIKLDQEGKALPAGSYLLSIEHPNGRTPRYYQLIVSANNITLKSGPDELMAWVTSLSDGAPVANLTLEAIAEDGTKVGTATSDTQGIVRFKLSEQQDRRNISLLSSCNDPTNCPDFSASSLSWSGSFYPGDFFMSYGGSTIREQAYIYSDRPIYRPGQTVELKGIVRSENDARYKLSPLRQATLVVQASDSSEIFNQTVQLNQAGSFSLQLPLAADAPLGNYTIELNGEKLWGYDEFLVSEYRVPEFEVAVELPTQELVLGNSFDATVKANYFFGAPLSDSYVEWRLFSRQKDYQPFESDYTWNEGGSFTCRGFCWWYPQPPDVLLLQGDGITDNNGEFTLSIPADLKDSEGVAITQTLELIVEATIIGRDNQVISNRQSVTVHGGDLYVGIKTPSTIGSEGKAQQIDLVTSAIDGTRLAGRTVDIVIDKVEWNYSFSNGEWTSEETRTPIDRQQVTSDQQGLASLSFTPSEGGSYQVRAVAQDSGGRTVSSSITIWVTSSSFVPWQSRQLDTVDLVSNRTSYKPGETAEILIPSPFAEPTWALISVERGSILSYEVLQLSSNSTIYKLPIEKDYAPNIFVSVVLFAGPGSGETSAKTKVGTLPLIVEPEPQSLQVSITPSSSQSEPGASIDYSIEVRDSAGKGVPAELSLDLVDKAVLSLQPRDQNAILEGFYGKRRLQIETISALSFSIQRSIDDLVARGQVASEPIVMPAPAADMAAPAAESAARAGGAAPSNQADSTVRSNFADTAFWQGQVTTDASGKASVQIKLPDNLTTWTLRAVAISDQTQVGEALNEVVSTKELLIRPVTPRFLVVGDEVELAANISNTSDQMLEAEVSLQFSGVQLSTPATVALAIAPKSESKVTWKALVEDAPAADLVFSVVAGNLSDSAKPRLDSGLDGGLPIYRYTVADHVGTGGQLTTGEGRTELIVLPPNVDVTKGELTVQLDPSLAASLQESLAAMEIDENSSNEFIVSRFLSYVQIQQALKQLQISNSDLEAKLPIQINKDIAHLQQSQNSDGGWAWWTPNPSNPYLSAYIVLALHEARDAGFSVSDYTMSRAQEFLQSQLITIDPNANNREANLQALLLFVISETGDSSQISAALQELLGMREKLGQFAKAYLAMALANTNPQDAGIQTLLSDLNTSAIMSATGVHWEEESIDWWSMNTNTRSTAITLLAMTRLDPTNQLNPNIVRWLMVARKAGGWYSSQENMWALMALSKWLLQSGELQGNYDYGVWLNTTQQTSGHVDSSTIGTTIKQEIAVADLLKDVGNTLTVGRSDGPGLLYYTAQLRSYLPVPEVKALDRGIIVQRRYTLASCNDGIDCPEVSEATVGDEIRVEITLIAPNDLYYLRLDDPLPAGAEAIDKDLATTTLMAQGPQFERQRHISGSFAPSYWSPFWFSRSELHDERVTLYADYVAKGTYQYSYTMRATSVGSFNVIPTTASELYFPEVFGRGDGQLFTIR
jgi:uncharacterized protein YfaS (alpha-2-macroglobulin family)